MITVKFYVFIMLLQHYLKNRIILVTFLNGCNGKTPQLYTGQIRIHKTLGVQKIKVKKTKQKHVYDN